MRFVTNRGPSTAPAAGRCPQADGSVVWATPCGARSRHGQSSSIAVRRPSRRCRSVARSGWRASGASATVVPAAAETACPPSEEFQRDLAAWLLRPATDGGVHPRHGGAAAAAGGSPSSPSRCRSSRPSRAIARRPRRPGLICSRLVRAGESGTAAGMPDRLPEEILLRAPVTSALLDLTVMIDSARRWATSTRAMERLLRSAATGRAHAPARLALVDRARPTRAGETILRLFHEAIEVAVEPQVELCDDDGQVVGRADLLVIGHRIRPRVRRRTPPRQGDSIGRPAPGARAWRGRRTSAGASPSTTCSTTPSSRCTRSTGRSAGRTSSRRLTRWRRLVEQLAVLRGGPTTGS